MRDVSQPSLIASIRTAVNVWRKRESWSRETVSQFIVESFENLEGSRRTELQFDPETRDAYQRTKVNADRIFRWLDDDSKDNNLLPANMIPFILAALPMDLRVECCNEILLPTELSVRITAETDTSGLIPALQSIAKEGGEAIAAMTNLLDGATPAEVANAKREITEAIHVLNNGLNVLDKAVKGGM